MSNYSPITDFGAKDALASGNPEKIILGADIDAELTAISTAILSKLDTLASQSEAETGTNNTAAMTPLRTMQEIAAWAAGNGGVVGDLQALADPNANSLVYWKDASGAMVWLGIGAGLTIVGDVLSANASGSVPTSRTLTAGTGLTGGGDLTADRSFALSHLGIEALADHAADGVLFWDDSAGATAWADAKEGVQISGTDLKLDVSGLTAQASPTASDISVPVYDASVTAHRKVALSTLVGAAAPVPIVKMLAADETRANNTLAASTALASFSLEAGTKYTLEGAFYTDCANSGSDAKFQLSASAALFASRFGLTVSHESISTVTGDSGAFGDVLTPDISNSGTTILVGGAVITGASACTVTLNFAQNATDAGNPLSLHAGSWLRFTKVP